MPWKFKDTSKQDERALKQAMQRATRKTAQTVKRRAKVPVDTGELRDSAEVNDAAFPRVGVAESSVDYLAEHGLPVEEGHYSIQGGYIPGQYFLRDALAASQGELDKNAANELKSLGCKSVRVTR